jgi:pimeloyl-ACP methyl ester carboxylesterase
METFESSDGTVIAYERAGEGVPLVLVGGALTDHASLRDLVRLLAPRFSVYSYDRRGRGSSSDTPPYSVELEVEDIEELIARTAGGAMVVGIGSGAALSLRAAADGVVMTAVVAYEPPYIVGDSRPRPPADLAGRVRAMVANGRLADAVERYLIEAAGLSPAAVVQLQGRPGWAAMEAVASTITHDLTIMGDCTVPTDRFARITIPVAILDNAASPSWLRGAARSVAASIPDASYMTLNAPMAAFDAATVAPVLIELLA